MFYHRYFDREKDLETFKSFLNARGLDDKADLTFFPPTGVLVLWNGKPICLGFMIKCDNNTCINSDLLSDPSTDKELRNEAVVYLRKVLEDEARKAGIPFIIATTTNPKLFERLKDQGYVELNRNLFQLGRAIWP